MNESMDRVLADWLREGPESGPREGLERALAATRRVGQKPGWAFLERWLPMQLTIARTPSLRPILAVVMLALLIVALVATALFIGSHRRTLPAPFGPARNGAVVYDEGGDLFIADELSGDTRALVAGPETGLPGPVFSNQGDRVAFVREAKADFQVMSVLPDGSGTGGARGAPGRIQRHTVVARREPPSSSTSRRRTITGFRFAVVNADGSGVPRARSRQWQPTTRSWRPDGEHIVFRGQLDDGTAGRSSPTPTGRTCASCRSTPSISSTSRAWAGRPTAKHLSFMSAGVDGVTGWQINIADIDADGNMTGLRPLKLDPDSTDEQQPSWSPDSSQLAFLLEKDFKRQVGIFNADGSGFRLVGPGDVRVEHPRLHLVAGRQDTADHRVPGAAKRSEKRSGRCGRSTSRPARQTEIQTPVATWQRLAP